MDIRVKGKFKINAVEQSLSVLCVFARMFHSLLGTAYPWYSLSSVMTSFRI